MSVRIVDPTPDPSIVKHVTCRNCGVKLSYVPKDVKRGEDRDYTGSTDPYSYIVCPGCNSEVRNT